MLKIPFLVDCSTKNFDTLLIYFAINPKIPNKASIRENEYPCKSFIQKSLNNVMLTFAIRRFMFY